MSLLLILLVARHRRARRRIEAPWLIPEPKQHTIVLAHGLLGFDHFRVLGIRQHYFRGIAEHLRAHGVGVYAARVRPLGTVPERAEALARFVKDLDARRVIIVGHSMGGLDARYALSKLGLSDQVRGLVTIATPHRGSCLADCASGQAGRVLRGLLGRAGVKTDALDWLGETPAMQFNQDVLDVSGVFYGSIVGQTTRTRVLANPILLACFELLLRSRGHNDGVVPAFSQRWGRELKSVPAHHFGQIGWSPLFDACGMYLELLMELHASGFLCLPNAGVPPLLLPAAKS